MKSIVLATVYFGEFPYYFSLFKKSAKANKDIDFVIFTDKEKPFEEDNIKVINLNSGQFAALASKKLGFPIRPPTPYKLCDFKLTFGKVFEDYFKGYDFWGHMDLDIIWGNIRKFITDEVLENHDLVSAAKSRICGPFTIYKNEKRYKDIHKKIVGKDKYERLMNSVEYEFIDEFPLDRVLKVFPTIKTFDHHVCGGGEIHLQRDGKSKTPAYWKDGKMIIESYLNDYNQVAFCGFGAETMFFHVREKNHWHVVDVEAARITSEKKEEHSQGLFYNLKTDRNIKIKFKQGLPFQNLDKLFLIHAALGGGRGVGGHNNYYHWLIQCMPHLLNALEKNEEDRISLYSHHRFADERADSRGDAAYFLGSQDFKITFIKEYIKLLGIEDRIFPIEPWKNYKVKSALVYENFHRGRGMKQDPDENIRNIRDFTLSHNVDKICKTFSKENVPRKFYIARANSRSISKKAEELILSEGFRRICMEDYDVIHQAAIFNYADVIISPHGAQLANLIFCKNNAKIVEISNGFNFTCYPDLARKTMNGTDGLRFTHSFVFEKQVYDRLREHEPASDRYHPKYLIKDPLHEDKTFVVKTWEETVLVRARRNKVGRMKKFDEINPCLKRLKKVLDDSNIL